MQVDTDRQKERLNNLVLIFNHPNMPDALRPVLARGQCANLLAGYFGNSKLRAAVWLVKQTMNDMFIKAIVGFGVFWHRRIMRRTDDEIDELVSR